MNAYTERWIAGPLTVVCIATAATAAPFTYQGQLLQEGRPVTALVTMDFRLYDVPEAGTALAGPLRLRDVDVRNGLFTVGLDFGDGAFDETRRYLAVSVVVPPGTTPVPLSPRQPIAATPFAIHALNAPGGTDGGTLDDAYDLGGPGMGREIVADAGQVHISGEDGLSVDGGVVSGPVTLNRATSELDVQVYKSFGLTGQGPDPVTLGGKLRRGSLLNPIDDWAMLRVSSDGHAIRRKTGTTLAFDVEGSINNPNFWLSQMLLSADGNLGVGLGNGNATTRLQVFAPNSDAEPGSGGILTVGLTNGPNIVVDENEIMARDNGAQSSLHLNDDGGHILMLRTAAFGGVGIGTGTPKGLLHVDGDYYGAGHMWLHAFEGDGNSGTAYIQARDTSSTSNVDLRLRTKNGTSLREVMTLKFSGRVGIGTTAPAELLHVNGTASVNVLKITGGADLSEKFEVADATAEPGMVVVIDPAHAGKLVPSSTPYDRKVAGVISGAGGVSTGMVMGHGGTIADGSHLVALTGRVYCLVDAAEQAVAPGDLLTTSNTPGHAMKVTDHARAPGAVLGKAMTPLAKGEAGLVLVLVTLQ